MCNGFAEYGYAMSVRVVFCVTFTFFHYDTYHFLLTVYFL